MSATGWRRGRSNIINRRVFMFELNFSPTFDYSSQSAVCYWRAYDLWNVVVWRTELSTHWWSSEIITRQTDYFWVGTVPAMCKDRDPWGRTPPAAHHPPQTHQPPIPPSPTCSPCSALSQSHISPAALARLLPHVHLTEAHKKNSVPCSPNKRV